MCLILVAPVQRPCSAKPVAVSRPTSRQHVGGGHAIPLAALRCRRLVNSSQSGDLFSPRACSRRSFRERSPVHAPTLFRVITFSRARIRPQTINGEFSCVSGFVTRGFLRRDTGSGAPRQYSPARAKPTRPPRNATHSWIALEGNCARFVQQKDEPRCQCNTAAGGREPRVPRRYEPRLSILPLASAQRNEG